MFNTICAAFDQCYTALNDKFPSCFCSEENDDYQDATCYDQAQRCINVPPDSDEICAYGIGTHRYQDNQFIGSWTGYEFEVDGTGNGGNSTLLDIWLPFPGPEVSDECFLEVNSNVCTSCTWTQCNGSLAFVADCSNAGFDGDIDSCDGSAPWAGFNFLFDVPEFHLDCMPSDQPSSMPSESAMPTVSLFADLIFQLNSVIHKMDSQFMSRPFQQSPTELPTSEPSKEPSNSPSKSPSVSIVCITNCKSLIWFELPF